MPAPAVAAAGRGESRITISSTPTFAIAQAIEQAIAEFRPDRIMHLAAESHVDRSITGAADFIQTNVVGTFTLARGGARLLVASSTAEPRRRSASCMSRPTRSMARSARAGCSPKTPPTIRARLTPRRRQRPTISPRRGNGPTACRSSSPTARTITGPITFPRS